MSRYRIAIQTVILSIVFLLLLVAIALLSSIWVAPGSVEEPGFKLEAVHVFVALVPFLMLLILSGKLKEISGPGGIALSLRDEAQKPVSLQISEMPLEIDPEIVQEKGGVNLLAERLAENPPTTLSFQIGRTNYYSQRDIEEYLDQLSQHPDFQNILFADRDGKFKGLMGVEVFRTLLQAGRVIEDIENGRILENPRVVTSSIPVNATNRQALTEMDRRELNRIAVVDLRGAFIGVLTQDEIIRKIMTKMLEEA
jgi:hypothetical protein